MFAVVFVDTMCYNLKKPSKEYFAMEVGFILFGGLLIIIFAVVVAVVSSVVSAVAASQDELD